jgi:hypothetical protein
MALIEMDRSLLSALYLAIAFTKDPCDRDTAVSLSNPSAVPENPVQPAVAGAP